MLNTVTQVRFGEKQDYLSSRPSEYLQVGIECFGGSDIAKEDAKLFS